MTNKIAVLVIVSLLAWAGIRLIVAERVSEPAYMIVAGNDYVQEQWNYCSRFDNRPNPATMIDRTLNHVNDAFFRISRPIFWLENKILGRRIEKGDPDYNLYMGRLLEIRVNDWDYAVFPNRDGSKLLVVKGRSIVQEIE